MWCDDALNQQGLEHTVLFDETHSAFTEISNQVSPDLQLARPACVLLDKQIVVCLSAIAQQKCLSFRG
jgi:hypothetical protein